MECQNCGQVSARARLQARLASANPDWSPADMLRAGELRADGDWEISGEKLQAFNIVACEECGGVLKPHVVGHGDASRGCFV